MALAGLHLTVEQTKAEKYARNEKSLKDLQAWMETTLGEKFQGNLNDGLKDGQVLCRLINKIRPDTVKKINKELHPFKQRENIESYLHGCQDLGMSVTDCFPVVNLFEQQDMNSVFANLSVLRHLSAKINSTSPHATPTIPLSTSKTSLALPAATGSPHMNGPQATKSPRVPAPQMARKASVASAGERRSSFAETKAPPPPISTPTLNASLEERKNQKYDKELEEQLRRWIEGVLGETMPKEKLFAEILKDGIVLCRLINKLKPGTITKINEQRMPFKQMENIEAYLTACKDLGIAELESFNTVDLYEEKNMGLVLVQLHMLATHAGKIPEWNGSVKFGEKAPLSARSPRRKKKKDPRALRLLRKGNWEGAKTEFASGKGAITDVTSLGQTALHIAAGEGLTDFVQWCIAQPGVSINAIDKDGYTPLATAIQQLRFEVAEFLIEKGADLSVASNDGSTVLHLLARLPYSPATVKIVDMILAKKVALTEVADKGGDKPLMIAAGSLNDGVLLCLLKRGATVGHTNNIGETALHKAARLVEQDEAALPLCKTLIDNGIYVNVKNSAGQTAFDLLPAPARTELEKHSDPALAEKLLSPRSVAELRLRRSSKKNQTPRGSYANVVIDPVYRIELGEKVPLDIELIQMPYAYRWNFAGRKHVNFAGYLDDDHAEPIFISVMEEPPASARVVVRIKDGTTETVETTKQPFSAEVVLQELITRRPPWKNAVFGQVDNLKLQSDLLDAEERDPMRTFRFPIGLVYSAAGNKTQWDMWNNEHGSKDFEQFCLFLGELIKLKGWTGYTGSLDVKNDTKGSQSIFTKFHGFDIMFHVSTYLPYDPKDERKLARSRMIGNDITMIIYQEGDTPYAPSTMTGGVSHVFLLVRPVKDKATGTTKYSLSCISKDYVPAFKPDIPEPALFQLDENFRNLLLTKLINGHSAAQSSPGLRMMYTRPRHAMLTDLAAVYCKNLLARLAREKGKVKPKGLIK